LGNVRTEVIGLNDAIIKRLNIRREVMREPSALTCSCKFVRFQKGMYIKKHFLRFRPFAVLFAFILKFFLQVIHKYYFFFSGFLKKG